jgi:hypothetical protein
MLVFEKSSFLFFQYFFVVWLRMRTLLSLQFVNDPLSLVFSFILIHGPKYFFGNRHILENEK